MFCIPPGYIESTGVGAIFNQATRYPIKIVEWAGPIQMGVAWYWAWKSVIIITLKYCYQWIIISQYNAMGHVS